MENLANGPATGNIQTEIYDDSVNWLTEALMRKAAGGLLFTEGPVWHPEGYFLFSDTPANKIYRLSLNGDIETWLDRSGLTNISAKDLSEQVGSNGLAIGNNGDMLICQHGNHAIAKLSASGKRSIVVDNFNRRPFNSPNDVIIAPDGTIFFTDPPYGLAGQVLHVDHYQPFAGIYKCAGNGVQLISAAMKYPNGLVFSADKKYLLVSSNHPDDPGIVRYSVDRNGKTRYAGIFMKQSADGMTIGPDENFYLATDDGVLIVSSIGKKLALLSLPETPSNCCWGGTGMKTLMVTARASIYFITP